MHGNGSRLIYCAQKSKGSIFKKEKEKETGMMVQAKVFGFVG